MKLTLNSMILGLFAAAGMLANDATSNAVSPKQTAEQLLTAATATRTAALDLMNQLKGKKADTSKVSEDVATIEKSAASIHTLLEQLESKKSELNSKQQAELPKAKQLADLLHLFLGQKKDLAADGVSAAERERIRSNAQMVARRAELLEKSVRRMGL